MNRIQLLGRLARNQSRRFVRRVEGYSSITPLGSMTLDKDDLEITQKWLKNKRNWYDEEVIKEFESRFAHWNGSLYAFSFMGARVALSAAIESLGLGAGDEVILPGYTCIVVPNAFNYANVKTVYCDIETETYGLDASCIQDKITSRTKAILIHHLYGLVSRDYEEVVSIARRNKLFIIEDCAQSTGAEYKGRKVGSLGDLAIYSSEQSKVFNTVQGGIATTNDAKIASGLSVYQSNARHPEEHRVETLLYHLILNYYRYKHPLHLWLGDLAFLWFGDRRVITTTLDELKGIRPNFYGEKMPAPVAELAMNQLSKIDHYNHIRRKTAKLWDRWCVENGYQKPLIIDGSLPVFLRYPVLVPGEKKHDRSWALKELGVELGVWFISHLHPSKQRVESCPNADQAVVRCINFPCILNSE